MREIIECSVFDGSGYTAPNAAAPTEDVPPLSPIVKALADKEDRKTALRAQWLAAKPVTKCKRTCSRKTLSRPPSAAAKL